MHSDGSTAVFAVDVAIPPPSHVRNRLSELNVQTLGPPAGFRFGPTRLPHLTLAQQFVSRDRLNELATKLGALLNQEDCFELVTTTVSMPRLTSTLGIELNPALVSLHHRIMDLLIPFHADGDGYEAFFTNGDPPRPADLEWVRGFRRRSAYASFDPHITLGVGKVGGEVSPLQFVATHVWLFHLGRFCTCRQTLERWTLTALPR